MKDWLKKGLGVFSSDSNVTEKHSAEYNKEKELSQSSDPKVRRKLAKKKTARPEILYYLADDKEDDAWQWDVKGQKESLNWLIN